MLDELRVVNLGILEDVRIDPGPGLTVVSGETGAGKTMMLGALRLLSGQRAQTDAVGPHGEEARVEGRIVRGDDEMVLARTVTHRGSRAYLDGGMVPNRVLEERTDDLIDIVGQDDRFQLLRPSALRSLIDGTMQDAAVIDSYRRAWERTRRLEKDLTALGGDRTVFEREREILRYQLQEIMSAGFTEGDDEILVRRAARLRNAGELAERFATSRDSIEEIIEASGVLISELRTAARLDPGMQDLVEEADALGVAASELSSAIRNGSEAIEHDPGSLEEVELRLAKLSDLRRKYGTSLEDVLAFAADTRTRLADLEHLLGDAGALGEELTTARAELASAAGKLSKARGVAISRVESTVTGQLSELGLAGSRISITMEATEPGPDGADRIRLFFASDARMEDGPLERVASGGELSRVVLALRLATGAGDAPILAFDEIDAGVGGETALVLGRKLAALSEGRQVLVVTHLPQVAAFADGHFVVERVGSSARVRRVEGEARLRELSRMLAGLPESAQGQLHAQELLAAARSE